MTNMLELVLKAVLKAKAHTIRVLIVFVALSTRAIGIEMDDLMGDPMDTLAPFMEPLKWLFTTLWGWVFVIIIACVAIALVYQIYGGLTSGAESKQKGQSGLIHIIGAVFVAIIVMIAVFSLFNMFIFSSPAATAIP